MFLTSDIMQWAVNTLKENCHPFIGITFLASKKEGLPVGESKRVKLDSLTKSHLERHHRLDPNSEFFFHPFRSNKRSYSYWVAANYSSSGLQSINTQTFGSALFHLRNTPDWGFYISYVESISNRIEELGGYRSPSLAAIAVWIGKDSRWDLGTDIDAVIARFRNEFKLTDEEVAKLFDSLVLPPESLQVTGSGSLDLKTVAYSFEAPPDAPRQTEGALTSIRLRDVGPAKDLYLEFGKRLTLIAGDNGLGKSFLLDAAWWALTGTWAGRPACPFRSEREKTPRIDFRIKGSSEHEINGGSLFNWRNHGWQDIENKPRPSIAAVSIYARVDGSFAIVDETRGELHTGGPRTLNLFTAQEVRDGKAGYIEGLIRDWVRWQQSSDKDQFMMLAKVLEHLSPDDMGPLVPSNPVRIPGEPRLIPTVKHVYGDVPVLFVSAGVQRVLLLAYLIIWSWQEHMLASEQAGVSPQRKMVIVIDELEAHLHPKWQRLVLPALMSVGKLLSKELDLQVIAATHSPMVLASIEVEFSDESDLLAHLSLVNGSVRLEKLEFYKYGDMSSWLMSPVFGLSHARSREAEQAIEEAKELQLSDEVSLDDVERVTGRLKQALAPDDTFWSRWIYFARKLGDNI